jgi:hypothetical protein
MISVAISSFVFKGYTYCLEAIGRILYVNSTNKCAGADMQIGLPVYSNLSKEKALKVELQWLSLSILASRWAQEDRCRWIIGRGYKGKAKVGSGFDTSK